MKQKKGTFRIIWCTVPKEKKCCFWNPKNDDFSGPSQTRKKSKGNPPGQNNTCWRFPVDPKISPDLILGGYAKGLNLGGGGVFCMGVRFCLSHPRPRVWRFPDCARLLPSKRLGGMVQERQGVSGGKCAGPSPGVAGGRATRTAESSPSSSLL